MATTKVATVLAASPAKTRTLADQEVPLHVLRTVETIADSAEDKQVPPLLAATSAHKGKAVFVDHALTEATCHAPQLASSTQQVAKKQTRVA